MNLLTTNEILRLNPVYRATDMANYCSNITIVEYDCFNTCFGLDFRNQMIDDLISYDNLENFQEDKVYMLGDAVIHMHTIYVSKVDDNAENLSSDNWEIGKMFNDDKFNGLWETGLGLYLSTKVIIQAYPHIAYQIEGKGIGKIYEDSGFRTVEKPEYYMILKSMEHTANLALKSAKMFFNANFAIANNDCNSKDNCGEEDDSRIAW